MPPKRQRGANYFCFCDDDDDGGCDYYSKKQVDLLCKQKCAKVSVLYRGKYECMAADVLLLEHMHGLSAWQQKRVAKIFRKDVTDFDVANATKRKFTIDEIQELLLQEEVLLDLNWVKRFPDTKLYKSFTPRVRSLQKERSDALDELRQLKRVTDWYPFPESQTYFRGLSTNEQRVVFNYSYHWDRILNGYLRGDEANIVHLKAFHDELPASAGKYPLKPKIRNVIVDKINTLQETILGFELPRATTVYRGIAADEFQYRVGDVFVEHGFTSTTLDIGVAEASFKGQDATCCVFRIDLPAGGGRDRQISRAFNVGS